MDTPLTSCSKCEAPKLTSGFCSNADCPNSLRGSVNGVLQESVHAEAKTNSALPQDLQILNQSDDAEQIRDYSRFKRNNILLGLTLTMLAAWLTIQFVDRLLEAGDLSFWRLAVGTALGVIALICFKFAFEMDGRILRLQGGFDDLQSERTGIDKN
ncbi:MAG: hypothetical protein AAGC81_08480 [Pseudomonadota bacterium]